MKKAAMAAAVALLVSGCAHNVPQVNRTAKADKQSYTKSAKTVQPVEAVTPNQIVKKRWYDRFKVHPKWFH